MTSRRTQLIGRVEELIDFVTTPETRSRPGGGTLRP
jgi:hypothetical protein